MDNKDFIDKDFADIVMWQIATLKHYHEIKASCLILDNATFLTLLNSCEESINDRLDKNCEDGHKYMGLLISISTSKKEMIKVA